MPFTNATSENITLYLFSERAFSPALPGTWYLALSTTTPTQASASNWNFTEPSGNGYTRVSVTNNSSNWAAINSEPTNGYSIWNVNVANFPQSTGSWGTITYMGLWDASTSGNLWAFGQLTNSFTVQTASILSFPANSLVITVD